MRYVYLAVWTLFNFWRPIGWLASWFWSRLTTTREKRRLQDMLAEARRVVSESDRFNASIHVDHDGNAEMAVTPRKSAADIADIVVYDKQVTYRVVSPLGGDDQHLIDPGFAFEGKPSRPKVLDGPIKAVGRSASVLDAQRLRDMRAIRARLSGPLAEKWDAAKAAALTEDLKDLAAYDACKSLLVKDPDFMPVVGSGQRIAAKNLRS